MAGLCLERTTGVDYFCEANNLWRSAVSDQNMRALTKYYTCEAGGAKADRTPPPRHCKDAKSLVSQYGVVPYTALEPIDIFW